MNINVITDENSIILWNLTYEEMQPIILYKHVSTLMCVSVLTSVHRFLPDQIPTL